MTPEHVIQEARAAGLDLLARDGKVGLRGPAEARQRLLPLFTEHKAEVLALLAREAANGCIPTPDEWREMLREHFEERAAILEYDAQLSRLEAEEQARRATALLACNAGAPWSALRHAVGDDALPNTDHPVNRTPYPLPDWCVAPDGKTAIRQGAFRL